LQVLLAGLDEFIKHRTLLAIRYYARDSRTWPDEASYALLLDTHYRSLNVIHYNSNETMGVRRAEQDRIRVLRHYRDKFGKERPIELLIAANRAVLWLDAVSAFNHAKWPINYL
jgi:hypothetical protein